jgi:formylglycine-generating enzyme required for sulfatase activity
MSNSENSSLFAKWALALLVALCAMSCGPGESSAKKRDQRPPTDAAAQTAKPGGIAKAGDAPKPGDLDTVDLGGGVKMELAWIPAGSFQMGSPDSAWGRDKDEGPVHTVELDGFWMGKYEVTQEQYEAVMGKNPSYFKGAKNPVEQVSWNNAADFCRKASQETGEGFRLPTEAEWEYACRAGSTTHFCFGDSDDGLGDYAWYAHNSGSQTHPVGEKKPNALGLYDMHGNVSEWCGDWYADKYSAGIAKNPQGPSSGEYRVARGGSWFNLPQLCRSAIRLRHGPTYRNYNNGFRVVVSAAGSPAAAAGELRRSPSTKH